MEIKMTRDHKKNTNLNNLKNQNKKRQRNTPKPRKMANKSLIAIQAPAKPLRYIKIPSNIHKPATNTLHTVPDTLQNLLLEMIFLRQLVTMIRKLESMIYSLQRKTLVKV